MSDKIYFSDKSTKRSANYYFVRALSAGLHRLSPAIAVKQTNRLLLTPSKSTKRIDRPDAIRQKNLTTPEGSLALYRIGEGKKVILTHGWSGYSGQFFPLMEKIAEAGFQAIAFDHFGHGLSSGKQANLPLFVKALRAVIEHEEQVKLACIISHSMGTIAALNQDKALKHLLIAPTFGFVESFTQRILSTGITPKLFNSMLSQVEDTHQMAFEDLLPEKHLALTKTAVHMVHDEQDKFAPISLSQVQSGQYPHVTLTTTKGLGHGRVINSESTWQAFQRLVI